MWHSERIGALVLCMERFGIAQPSRPAAPSRRYQGRLTWKGRCNVRNPAIAVALELMLESLREGRGVGAGEAGAYGDAPAPVALPVRLSPMVPPCTEGEWLWGGWLACGSQRCLAGDDDQGGAGHVGTHGWGRRREAVWKLLLLLDKL